MKDLVDYGVCSVLPEHAGAQMLARGANQLRSMGSIDSVSSFDSLRAPAHVAVEGAAPNGVPRSPNRFPAAAGNGGVPMPPAANGGAKESRPPFGMAVMRRCSSMLHVPFCHLPWFQFNGTCQDQGRTLMKYDLIFPKFH